MHMKIKKNREIKTKRIFVGIINTNKQKRTF
jgi:hypothetical protein